MNYHTSIVDNCLDPLWDEMFLVIPPPQSDRALTFTVMDSDSGIIVDGTDDFLGAATARLPAVDSPKSAPGAFWTEVELPLQGAKAKGTLHIRVRPYLDVEVCVKEAVGLRKADGIFGKSDPFAAVTGLGGDCEWGKTQVVKKSLEPVWNEKFTLRLLEQLPQGGPVSRCIIKLLDHDEGVFQGGHDALGEAVVPWQNMFPAADEAHGANTVQMAISGKGGQGQLTVSVAAVPPPASGSDLAQAGQALLAAGLGTGGGGGGGGGGGTPPPGAGARVAKASAVLATGDGVKVADPYDNVPDVFTLGLAWDLTNGEGVDLDASCIMLDKDLQKVDLVYFGKKTSDDGAVRHSGDNQSGRGDGDDESIVVDLPKVDVNIHYLGFVINSYSGKPLSCVSSARARLYNTGTGQVAATTAISDASSLQCEALVMCALYRNGPDWYMHAIDEGAHGRTAEDNVDELQAFLATHQLPSHRPPPGAGINAPKLDMAVGVPPGVQPGGCFRVQMAGGFVIDVTVPPGVDVMPVAPGWPGPFIRVTQPEMYTQR
jgi:tellurium resistance protein TerZ